MTKEKLLGKKFSLSSIPLCPKCKVPYEDHTCFWSACAGCKDGHSSFHRSIISSPQWWAWEKEVARRMAYHNKKKSKTYTGVWDTDECREGGYISEEHLQDFFKFIKTKL